MDPGYTPATSWYEAAATRHKPATSRYTPASTATTDSDIGNKLKFMDSRGLAWAALVIAVIAVVGLVILSVFLCKLRLNRRDDRRDAERGRELGTVSRGAPPPEAEPQQSQTWSPVGATPSDSHGRPVAAYNTGSLSAGGFETVNLHGGEADS